MIDRRRDIVTPEAPAELGQAGVGVRRLMAINTFIRVAAAASGQLFAFFLASRWSNRHGLGSTTVGLLAACFFLTELAGAPIAGGIADARGQRRVLAYAPLWGAASAGLAAAAALGNGGLRAVVLVLVVARTAEGASAACAVPTTLTLLSRATEGNAPRRMRVMGLFEITSLVGMIAGYALAGIGWDLLDARAFLLLVPVYGAARILIGRSTELTETPAVAAPPLRVTVGALAGEPGNVAFGIAWLAVNAVVGVWMQHAPYLLKLTERSPSQQLVGGFTGREISAIFAVWGLTFLAGLTGWSLLGSRWAPRRTLFASLLGMLGVVATLAAVNHGASPALLSIAMFCILAESGFTPAALSHLADLTRHHDASRGAALGLYSLMLGAGQLIGSLAGAPFAAAWQMDGLLIVTALLAGIALLGVGRMGDTPIA
jgi:MFS family permease